MAFYTDGVVPWNSLDDNTRAPLASELEGGYPCGEADQELFNWTAGWPIGNIWNMILQSGITPDADKLLDLARAMQSGKVNYAAATGTANALTATLSPAPASLTVGMTIHIKVASSNTGSATIDVNGLGAKNILRMDGTALQQGDLPGGGIVTVCYSGDDFRLLGTTAASNPVTPPTSYSTPGTYSYTVPDGVYQLIIEVWGAGGGGGGAGTTGTPTAASGGGGGAYKQSRVSVVPGQVLPVVVGAGGSGGVAGGGAGGSGGTSSVGALVSSPGGGAAGGAVNGGASTAGAGGVAAGADVNIQGRFGQGAIFVSPPIGGFGGASYQSSPSGPNTSTGQNGVFPGGGGSGGTGNLAGGSGASGFVIISVG